MNRDYIGLWSLLAVAFIIFFGLSMCDEDHVPLGLRPSQMAQSVLGAPRVDTPASVPDTVRDAADADHAVPQQPPRRVVYGQDSLTIMIIGDSMLEGLALRLGAYCRTNGHKLYTVIWYSSTSELYGRTHLITDYINAFHPDYIFLSLGGNELFVNDIATKRDKYVKSIVAEFGDIPYLWIGPPNWKPDTGINDLIRSNVPEGCYFRSAELRLDRKRDGAHPTEPSAAVWMDSVIRWMPAHARYPIVFDNPPGDKTRGSVRIHQPGDLDPATRPRPTHRS